MVEVLSQDTPQLEALNKDRNACNDVYQAAEKINDFCCKHQIGCAKPFGCTLEPARHQCHQQGNRLHNDHRNKNSVPELFSRLQGIDRVPSRQEPAGVIDARRQDRKDNRENDRGLFDLACR